MNYEKVYTGVSTYGRIKIIMSSVLYIILSIVGIIVGIMILNSERTKNNKYSKLTSATIKNIKKTEGQPNSELEIEYTVDKNIYNRSLTILNNSEYQIDRKIDIKYDPNDPFDFIIVSRDSNTIPLNYIGYGFIFISILVIIGFSIRIYITKYNEYTAVEGTKDVVENVGGAFSRLFK